MHLPSSWFEQTTVGSRAGEPVLRECGIPGSLPWRSPTNGDLSSGEEGGVKKPRPWSAPQGALGLNAQRLGAGSAARAAQAMRGRARTNLRDQHIRGAVHVLSAAVARPGLTPPRTSRRFPRRSSVVVGSAGTANHTLPGLVRSEQPHERSVIRPNPWVVAIARNGRNPLGESEISRFNAGAGGRASTAGA